MVAQDMASAATFRVGEVVNKSFSIWFRNIFFFLIIGLLSYVPGLLLQLAFPVVPDPQAPFKAFTASLPAALTNGVFAQLMTAIVTYAVIQRLRGQPIQFGAAFSAGFNRFLPVLLTALCAGILIGLASLAFLIPGLILSTVFWVAVPACVSEKLGAGEGLSRSSALTKGHRWPVFGILLLLGVLGIVGGLVFGVVIGFLLSVAHVNLDTIRLIATFGAQAMVGSLAATFAATGYYFLRVTKEGVDIDQIAAVFD